MSEVTRYLMQILVVSLYVVYHLILILELIDVSRLIIWFSGQLFLYFQDPVYINFIFWNFLRRFTVLKELKLGWLLHLCWYNDNICILHYWTRQYRASFIIICKLYMGPKVGWGILHWNLHERIISGDRAVNAVGILLLFPESKRFSYHWASRPLTDIILR